MKFRRAFTLLEILVVLSIIGVLTSYFLVGLSDSILAGKIKVEDAALATIRADIERSFDSDDYSQVNIAAFSGEVPNTVSATTFNTSPDGTYSAMADTDWYAKVARGRGIGYSTAAPTRTSQPAIGDLLYNDFNRARLLIAGPTSETGHQRFLLISIEARPEQLVLPTYDGAGWFDAVWNTDWNTKTGQLPSYWTSRLTTAQTSAWNGDSRGSKLFRLRVVKINVPRFNVTISNTHPTSNGYVYYNGTATTGTLVTVAAGAGVRVISNILAGRTVTVLTGSTLATAGQTNQFQLRQNTDITVQSL